MKTLVLPPRYTVDTNTIRFTALEMGYQVERLPSWNVPQHLKNQEIFLYGEPLFASVVASSFNISLIEPPFHWLTQLSDKWLGRDIRFMILEEVEGLQNKFIKPADDKCFLAKVYDSGSDIKNKKLIPKDTPILVADPVNWIVEYRCFILDNKLMTLSPYLRNGQLSKSKTGEWIGSDDEMNQAKNFIQDFIAENSDLIPPAIVIDVGIIKDIGWAVIEANAAWGSGIYNCNPLKILPVLERATLNNDTIGSRDLKWVLER